MMRSFLIRLSNSVTRADLLVPCLLVCLACATPLPLEKLEEGISTEAVRQEFGEPEATRPSPESGRSRWCYHDGGFDNWWADGWWTKPVLLDFEDEKLVRWEKIVRYTQRMRRPTDPLGTPRPEALDETKRLRLCNSIIPTNTPVPNGPEWIFDPSVGHPEPDTSCKSERTAAEGRVEAGDMRHAARTASLWIEPHTASSDAERVSVDRGQPLRILGTRCGWCRVEDDVGTIGWIACVFLDAGMQP